MGAQGVWPYPDQKRNPPLDGGSELMDSYINGGITLDELVAALPPVSPPDAESGPIPGPSPAP